MTHKWMLSLASIGLALSIAASCSSGEDASPEAPTTPGTDDTAVSMPTTSPTDAGSIPAVESPDDDTVPTLPSGTTDDTFPVEPGSTTTTTTTTTTQPPTTTTTPTTQPPTTTTTTTTTPPTIIPGDVLFETGRWDLRPEAQLALEETAEEIVAKAPNASLLIVGHTDSRGTEEYNQVLSERRALSVHIWFVGWGFPESDVTSAGRGESELLVDPDVVDGVFNEDAGARNRRVAIYVSP